MASRALPPPKKKSRQPAPTTIHALGDDLLREVFLRLPSLPSLVRAALACPAFLGAVRSSPAFHRRFCDLHSHTILGAFLVSDEPDIEIPTFAPVRLSGRRSDPDHAAALRELDVFLTRLPDAIGDKKDDGKDTKDEEEEDDDEPEWSMSGCGNGYVILITPPWNTKKVAVYDPLTGALHLFPAPPYELLGGESEYTEDEFHVISSQADDRSFRLLCVSRDKGRTQVAVFPPDTTSREWQISPTTGDLRHVGNNGTLVNGFLYWVSVVGSTIHVLNTATLQFSQIDLPIGVSCGQATYKACLGETKDGKLCLVRATDLRLCIWVRRAAGDDDGVEKWLQYKSFPISDAIHELALGIIDECPWVNVVAIVGGIVYLSIDRPGPSFF